MTEKDYRGEGISVNSFLEKNECKQRKISGRIYILM